MTEPGPLGGPDGTAAPGRPLRVRVLGTFQIEGVDLRALRSRKARALLKILALGRDRPVSVDRLVDGLWAGDAPAVPERELAVNVSRARRLVGRERIQRSDAGYRLHFDWLDLDRLDGLATEARRRASGDDHVAARTLASAGLALVTGPLLADEPDAEWLVAERAGVERTVAELRGLAAAAALGVGELAEAAALADQALAADPYDEAATRVLMRARLRSGRPGSALAAYSQMRRRLADDLGASPAPETESLHLTVLMASEEPTGDHRAGSRQHLSGDLDQPGSATQLVRAHVPGREAALGQLDAAAQAVAASGSAEVVLVEGEAGSGKTHLLDAFAAAGDGTGGVVLRARCDELGRALPLQPIADALAAHLHLRGPQALDEVLAEDRDLLGPLLGLSSPVVLPTLPGPGMSGDAMQTYVFGALLRTLARLAGLAPGQPTILLIDDLHLAGSSTLEWLHFVTRRRLDTAVLLVVARRPEEHHPAVGTRRIELDPLDLAAAREIVGGERAELLLERSGGNALLLIELAAAPSTELPATIRESVSGQLERAGPEVAATIRTAAILGPDIDLDLLAEVSGCAPLELLDHLERATARLLLAERGSRFTFRHALVQEVVVAETSSARQALVHGRAAAVLAARPDHDPLDLADHARRAGDAVTAAAALAEAAELARGHHDLAEAEALLGEAIALHDTVDLRLQRGHLRIARSRFDEADGDARVAAAAGRRAEGLALRAWIARHRHDFATAIRLGDQGAAEATDPTTRASCLLAAALSERGQGDLPAAEQRIQAAMAIRAPVDLGLPGWLGVLRVFQGQTDEALDLLEPAAGSEIDTVHSFWVEHVLQMTAHANALRGRPDRALAALDRWRDEMVRRGSDARYRGGDDNYRAWILGSLGQPEAAELTEAAMASAAMPEILAQALLDDASRRCQAGDLDRAAESTHRAEAVWTGTDINNRWRCEARATSVRARIHLAAGEPAAALTWARATRDASEARGEQRYATLGRLLVARSHGQLGRPVDLDEVETDLARLPQMAGLEAWWLTAECARDLGVDRWWDLAEQRAAELARHAGARAESFRAAAARRLDQGRLKRGGR